MIEHFIENSRKCGINFSVITLSILGFGVSVQAGEKTDNPPEMVYDNIPAKWNYYFVSPEVLGKYRGDKIEKVCLDEDFIQDDLSQDESRYQKHVMRTRSKTTIRYKLLTGARDFIVIDKKHMVLSTPETGSTLIETRRGCWQKALTRAKYIYIRDDINRSLPTRCLSRRKDLPIFTRFKSGAKVCDISRLYKWTGPTDSLELKSESNALRDSRSEQDEK